MTTESTINPPAVSWLARPFKAFKYFFEGLHSLLTVPNRNTRLKQQATALGGERRNIAEVADRVEAQFLHTATELEEISDLSGRLVTEAERVFEVALGKADAGSLSTPGTNLITWLNSLHSAEQQVHDVFSGITRHQRRLERVLNQEKRLNQIVGTLQILPSLFKIESAPLKAENRQLFLDLVNDIDRVQKKVSLSLSDSFRTVESMGRRLSEGRSRFQQFVETKCRNIGERKGQLEASLIENNRQLEANTKENVELLESTRETHQQVGRVVIALQYQDITRQKLQHIDRMCHELEDALQQKGDERRRLQFCAEAATLCQAHSDSVMLDLDSAYHEISTGVGEIEQRLGRLDETFLTLRQFSDLAISADGFIQNMLDASEELEELAQDLVSGVREMYEVLELLRGALSGLSVTMGQVSAEIRLIALNAQVQAIQNGLGTGLEILSARTCDVADDMYAIGQEMSTALADIADTVKNDLDLCRGIQDQGDSLLELLKTQGQEDANQLHSYRDHALDMLMSVYNLSNDISSRAQQVAVNNSVDRLARPVLSRANEILGRIQAIGEGSLSRKRRRDRGATVEHFRHFYSIASEIETHDRVFAPSQGATAADPPPPAAPESTATTPAPASEPEFRPLPTLSAPAAGSDDEPVLFDEAPEVPDHPSKRRETAATPAAAAGSADHRLGDNIELF